MNVVNDLSFLSLITGATIPVQLVMLILLAASGFSWWYIFIKVSVLKSAELAVDEFENTFWTSGDLNKLHDSIHSGRIKNQGLATIFEAGYKEFNRHMAQATLTQVAPGIAEALIATAIGLFAAIPAVIAYNRFATSVDRLSVRYESFMEEFVNILQRKG